MGCLFQARFFESSPDEKVILVADTDLYGTSTGTTSGTRRATAKPPFMGHQPVYVGTVLATQQAM